MGFSLTDFTCRYPNLLPFESAKDLEDLTQEVHDYATMEDEELPKAVKELARGLAHGVAYQRDILTTYLCSIAFFNSQKPTYFVVCS